MSRFIADLLGDVSAEALFGMSAGQVAGRPTLIARRLDYLTDSLSEGKADVNPRYPRPAGRQRRRLGMR